jgi:hypothetical protein
MWQEHENENTDLYIVLISREKMERRSKSMKMRVLGIFPDATVVRGMDWEWKDQDGNIFFFWLKVVDCG